MRKHQGLSIIELLGSIVIFSIASTLIALIISFIINANNDIIENGQANTTGTLIIRQIENEVNDLFITDYAYLSNQELILYSDYEYIYDETLNDIVLVNYDPRLTLTIQFLNEQLFLNDNALDLSGFTLHPSSQIDLITHASSTEFMITIVLASKDHLYTFNTSFYTNL